MVDKVKDCGQIYTPIEITRLILDYCGYFQTPYIRRKHVIDPSCGDGAILCEVVRRYIESYIIDGEFCFPFDIEDELRDYIHGIEIDKNECEKCKENLNSVLDTYNINHIDWDIVCGNSLKITKFNGNMDFVVGNPPYIRTKNIKKSDDNKDEYKTLKLYDFASKGMSDLYLAFYEYGLKLRNETGVLCYIAPVGWINSTSGDIMRKYVYETHELSSVIDFEHIQIFKNAQTYVMVALFDKKPHKFIRYDKYSESDKYFFPVSQFSYDDVFINGKMYFTNKTGIDILKNVNKNRKKLVTVKNGYATLLDDFFINNLPHFNNFTIPVLKSSTGEWKKCLFPYDRELRLIGLGDIKNIDNCVYEYIMENRKKLEERTYDSKNVPDSWYSLGRSQGLCDTYKYKIAINCMVRTKKDLKITEVKSGEGVYGGLYIISKKIDYDKICSVLKTDDFIEYVKSLKKYKSGGYYTFSSKDVENYINYKLVD